MVTRVVNLRRPSLRSGSRPQALCSSGTARSITAPVAIWRIPVKYSDAMLQRGKDGLGRLEQARAGMGAMGKVVNAPAEETLDPDNWSDVEALSRQIIGDAVDYLRAVRDRPVWQEMPTDVKAFFASPLPRSPAPLAEVYREVVENLMSYPMGNVHPRFWAWYMGSSNFTGALVHRRIRKVQ